MSLQYISDNSGATTAVIIPIEEWNNIVQTHADLKRLGKPVRKEKKLKPSAFAGTISKEEGARFREYLTKVRKEWDRNFS